MNLALTISYSIPILVFLGLKFAQVCKNSGLEKRSAKIYFRFTASEAGGKQSFDFDLTRLIPLASLAQGRKNILRTPL